MVKKGKQYYEWKEKFIIYLLQKSETCFSFSRSSRRVWICQKPCLSPGPHLRFARGSSAGRKADDSLEILVIGNFGRSTIE
jgi:hypothetical protein